jgi:hypothetical protein
MTESTGHGKLKWVRNALWIATFASFGFTADRRWITGVLFLLAIAAGWLVDRAVGPDGHV